MGQRAILYLYFRKLFSVGRVRLVAGTETHSCGCCGALEAGTRAERMLLERMNGPSSSFIYRHSNYPGLTDENFISQRSKAYYVFFLFLSVTVESSHPYSVGCMS